MTVYLAVQHSHGTWAKFAALV